MGTTMKTGKLIDGQVAQYAAIEQYLETRMPHYMALLEDWVDINSFTLNSDGVNRLGEVTAEAFIGLGFSAEFIQSDNAQYGKHLVLTRQGSGNQRVGFVSHLDTVFPLMDELLNDFRWREEGERIYGPGTIDIKGGTLVIYMMMDALMQLAHDVYDAVTWVILLDASEETEGEHFGRICNERLAGATACLVFEAGYISDDNEFKLVTQRKGMMTYRIAVEGKASHAGSDHPSGANAIVQMAEIIKQIAGFTDYERDITFNVGTVNGGTVTNRVPHEAVAWVEMRAFDMDVYNEGVAKMLAFQEMETLTSADGYKCTVLVDVHRQTKPWPENAGTQMLYDVWKDSAESLGYKVTWQARGGLSDGNFIWENVPTIDALGPDGANVHCSERSADGSKDQEYAIRGSFVPKALLNTVALLNLINNG
jgi:glutamate carboxypeptidase